MKNRFIVGKHPSGEDKIDWTGINKKLSQYPIEVKNFKKGLEEDYGCLTATNIDIYLAEIICQIEDKNE